MTITTTKNRINQTADGIQTIFIYDFIVLDASHMFPYFDDVLQTAGFTVNGVGDPAGGDVTFDVPPADGVTVTLLRAVPFTQLVDYIPYDPFPAETHEGALDKLTLITQQIEDLIERSLQLPVSTEAGNLTLPEPIPQNLLQWNNAGDGLINVTLADAGVLVVTPFAETLLDDPDADTHWATLMATITKLTARSSLGAAGVDDANTFSDDNTFDGANILNGINTFNDKAIFNGLIHQSVGSNIASAAALPNITDGNYAHVTALAAPITGATQANPVVITAVAHGLTTGEKATFANVGGMIEINGIEYTVTVLTPNTFELDGIDGTGFTAYTAGGSIWASITSLITTTELGTIIKREFDGVLILTHHATNLILFGSNIVTADGDVATLMEYANGDFKLLDYTRGDGVSIGAGAVVQEVITEDSAVATGTTVLPFDDTIPQNTEGVELMTVSITPTNASNKLIIEANIHGANSNANSTINTAIFQDSIVDALAAGHGGRVNNANSPVDASIKHEMVAGTTSPITFKIRAGMISAGTLTFNGTSGGRRFGGVMASFIKVTEVLA